MKAKTILARLLGVVLAAGIVASGPASIAQTLKAGGKSPRSAMKPFSNEASDPSPTVHIRMQIQGVGDQIDVFGYQQQTRLDLTLDAGGGAPKFDPGTVTVMKRIDGYTPALNRLHSTGEHIREVVLQWFRVDPNGKSDELFFTMNLQDCAISSILRTLPNQQDASVVRLGESEAITFVYRSLSMSTPSN